VGPEGRTGLTSCGLALWLSVDMIEELSRDTAVPTPVGVIRPADGLLAVGLAATRRRAPHL
jgi:hypothetical protein